MKPNERETLPYWEPFILKDRLMEAVHYTVGYDVTWDEVRNLALRVVGEVFFPDEPNPYPCPEDWEYETEREFLVCNTVRLSAGAWVNMPSRVTYNLELIPTQGKRLSNRLIPLAKGLSLKEVKFQYRKHIAEYVAKRVKEGEIPPSQEDHDMVGPDRRVGVVRYLPILGTLFPGFLVQITKVVEGCLDEAN